jgi:hypothetical protein
MPPARVAHQADVAAIAGLWLAANVARQAELGLPLGPVAGGGIAEAERQVQGRLADPASFTQLVEEDGVRVAMALVLQALDRDGVRADPLPGRAQVLGQASSTPDSGVSPALGCRRTKRIDALSACTNGLVERHREEPKSTTTVSGFGTTYATCSAPRANDGDLARQLEATAGQSRPAQHDRRRVRHG